MLARAVAAGVETVLIPGVDRAQWERASVLRASAGVGLRFAVGVHPRGEPADCDALEEWIDRLEACAVGELGWDKRLGGLDRQTELAEAQLEVARARGLPVILHVVGAHGLALERLEKCGAMRGVVHGYSGAAELVPRYLALGLSISFGPSVIRPRARKVREAARRVPLARLLVETDGPDQRVEGSARGEPADVARVIEALAELRGERAEDIDAATTENARRLFG